MEKKPTLKYDDDDDDDTQTFFFFFKMAAKVQTHSLAGPVHSLKSHENHLGFWC